MLFMIVSCDSTKSDYTHPVDEIAIHTRNIEIVHQNGSNYVLEVFMPEPYTKKYQWNRKDGDIWVPFAYGKTITYEFTASTFVRVHAFSGDGWLWSNAKMIYVK